MKKFEVMAKHIALRKKAWNIHYSFLQRVSGYIQMGLFIKIGDIEAANKGLEHSIAA